MSESFALLQKDEITDENKLVQNHLQSLHDMSENYFTHLNDFDYKLICNTFRVDPGLFSYCLQDELMLNF